MATATSGTPWTAVFSPQHGSYYFFNSETNETTWENPLAPPADAQQAEPTSDSTSESTDLPPSQPESSATKAEPYTPQQYAAIAQGIDPSLAYLDPSLGASASTTSTPGSYGATAKFNARTGQFTRPDGRDPTHLSEYERAKRMSEFYFDVGAWEQQRDKDRQDEAEAAAIGKKKKRPSKKDLVRSPKQLAFWANM